MGKKKIIIGWVHDTKIYSDYKDEYIACGEVIYKKKRFDTPHKIKLTIEKINRRK